MSAHRYLVTNGYELVSKEDAIIITNVFTQASFRVTREVWRTVVGSSLPYPRNDVRLSEEEFKVLHEQRLT